MFTGGVRCGKSSLAQAWAERQSARQLYIATCCPRDAEMLLRVRAHQNKRGKSWLCLEESKNPLTAVHTFIRYNPDFNGALLVDSLDMLLNNLLEDNADQDGILADMEALFKGLDCLGLPCALVSAECGMGFIPLNPVARKYGDLLGLCNQMAAALCETVILVSCGLPLVLKGELK